MLTTKEVYMRNFVGRRQFLKTRDRKSTRLNSSHLVISYAVFCLKKKKKKVAYLLENDDESNLNSSIKNMRSSPATMNSKYDDTSNQQANTKRKDLSTTAHRQCV